jgi:hypothetical protein
MFNRIQLINLIFGKLVYRVPIVVVDHDTRTLSELKTAITAYIIIVIIIIITIIIINSN